MENVPHILIVDDEPSARQTIEMLLFKEGYDLSFAENGVEAVEKLKLNAPDVLLLDVMMPGKNGFEVCEELKTDPQWRHIPIILVTALDSKKDLARGLDAGADDFLHKPFNGLELRARVRSMLRIKQRHDDLQASLRLRDDLSNMIVHDIRSPLSSMIVYTDLLDREVATESGREYLSVINSELGRLNTFLTDMLMMAKMEHGRLKLAPARQDMNQLLEEAVRHYQPIAQLKRLTLTMQTPAETHFMTVDTNLWRRLLDNLLSNAVKFSPTGRDVSIILSYPHRDTQDDDLVLPEMRIQVLDQGPGIPPEFHETIFDKFEIVATGRRDVAQVGLGLAFCKMVTDAHNGRIFVDSNTPTGSIFTVEL